jgi:hypothetical protein
VSLLLPALFGLAWAVASGWRTDPFSGRFTYIHLFPHILGLLLLFVCVVLPYGNDHKGAWIFLLVPSQTFDGFARGICTALWVEVIVIPNLILFPLLIWRWGIWHAGLFVAYSIAVASTYLALELRLIEGIPFCKQPDASRGATLLPMMMVAGIAMGIAVGLQHFLVFHSPALVAIATTALGIAAYFVTRASVGALAVSIRYHLGVASAEIGTLYKEIGI